MRWIFITLAFASLLAAGGVVAPKISRSIHQNEQQTPDEPPLPVKATINGLLLSIPRDLVRFETQKADGDMPRIDLLFHWPSLKGRGVITGKPDPLASLIFLSIASKDDSLPPIQRLGGIYHKFLSTDIRSGPGGLAAHNFLPESGYDGEELMYDPAQPGQFFVRCAPPTGSAPASCLREMRIMDRIDVVYRAPKALLEDWKNLDNAVMALLAAIGVPEQTPAQPSETPQ